MSLPPPIIGLTGRAGAGKDTAYGYIEEWASDYGLKAQRVGFADALKVSAAKALGFVGDTPACIEFCNRLKVDGSVSAIDGDQHLMLSGREFLQLYGTEAHRDVFGDDFWIEAAFANREVETDILVMTDCRFPNEAEAIRSRGGEVWRIERPAEGPQDAHASETPLPDNLVDRTIWNVNDKDQLRYNLRYTLTGIAKQVKVNL